MAFNISADPLFLSSVGFHDLEFTENTFIKLRSSLAHKNLFQEFNEFDRLVNGKMIWAI